jgi:hypothetical protein
MCNDPSFLVAAAEPRSVLPSMAMCLMPMVWAKACIQRCKAAVKARGFKRSKSRSKVSW